MPVKRQLTESISLVLISSALILSGCGRHVAEESDGDFDNSRDSTARDTRPRNGSRTHGVGGRSFVYVGGGGGGGVRSGPSAAPAARGGFGGAGHAAGGS
jgi:hypothetical protein